MNNITEKTTVKQHRKSSPKPRISPKQKSFFAERLTKIRLEENLTQEQFAARLGNDISKQKIYLIESGKRALNTELLYKICMTFDISADYFFGRSNNRKNHREDANGDRRGEELSALREELNSLCKNVASIAEKVVAIETNAKTLLNHPLLN
ncbi:MAG: helix-turn-helix transcriptional regulator [Alphaproteobacteria bacterium]|nr:helix-turn-helix transcriptional regulator [Alphaproteobacteria bacterium]